MDWDPFNGKNYKTTPNSTVRRDYQTRTSINLSEDCDNSLPQRRSKRKKKQKKPETIDILSSDSEDDGVILDKKDIHIVNVSVSSYLVHSSTSEI